MPYDDGMAVDRLSVTVPSELGEALRMLAEARGETVSMLVTEAIAHQVRTAALERALADADKRFGPVSTELIDKARTELATSRKPRSRKRRSRT